MHSQGSQPEPAELVPEHPPVWTLVGSPDAEILRVAEQVYWGEHVVAPSVLPCCQQDECMRDLHQELARCMARAKDAPTAIPLYRPDPRQQGPKG